MTTLGTLNYIHTLFLYELGIPFKAVVIIRSHLQEKLNKCDVFYDWLKSRMMQTNVPNFNNHFFENITDMELYKTWQYSRDFFKVRPLVRYLRCSTIYKGFCISIQGLDSNVDIIARSYIYPQQNSFFENSFSISKTGFCSKDMSEDEFYTKLDCLLNDMNSTDKIPFELFNVK